MSTVSPGYRPDIDGLRGIAVFCVVVFHAGLPGFHGGFVGVDIFFVISGYLIGAIIQREIEEKRFSFAKFYARRAKRILPALFATLLMTFLVSMLVMTSAELKDFSRSALATTGAFSNIYFWKSASYFSTGAELKPLMMTWSLSVEEQFYLFFPPLLLVIHRMTWRPSVTLTLLCVFSLAASVWMTSHKPTTAFFLLPTRAWELGVGALLAQYMRNDMQRIVMSSWLREALGITGLAALIYAITCFDDTTPFPGIAAAAPVSGAAFLIATRGSAVNRYILSNKALVFIGVVSYSWYLWHWPLLSFARIVADHPVPMDTLLTLAGLSFLVAILSWRFIEQPFRSTRHSDSKTLRHYGAATTAMLAIGAVVVAASGWQGRLPGDFVALEQTGGIPQNPCLAGYGQLSPNLGKPCIASDATQTVALIGDSHAAALAPGLRALAARYGDGYTELTKSSCPALDGVTRFMPNHPGHDQECTAFNRAALARLRDDPSITVVFVAGYWSAPFAEEAAGQRFVAADASSMSVTPEQSRQYLRQGLEATIKYLSASGKRIVLLKDVPIFDFDPLRSVATEQIPVRKWIAAMLGVLPAGEGRAAPDSMLKNKGEPANTFIDEIAKQHAQVIVVDPAISLCDNGRCRYSGAGKMYYIDPQHLSEAGSEIVVGQTAIVKLMVQPHVAVAGGAPTL